MSPLHDGGLLTSDGGVWRKLLFARTGAGPLFAQYPASVLNETQASSAINGLRRRLGCPFAGSHPITGFLG